MSLLSGSAALGNWVLSGTLSGAEISVTGKKLVTDPTTLDLRQAVAGGYSIVSVDGFTNTTDLETVYLPDSLQTIGMYAFRSCGSLTTVSPLLPSNLTFLGYCAFAACTNLEGDVVFPANTITTPSRGYSGTDGWFRKTKITSCDMSAATCARIPARSFLECKHLEWMKLPQGIESIKSFTFQYCDALHSVTPFLLSTITSVGASAFHNCTNLVGDLVIDNTAPVSIVQNNNNAYGNFMRTRITSATLTAPIPSLPSATFANCTELKSVILPETLVTINSQAFAHCPTRFTANAIPRGPFPRARSPSPPIAACGTCSGRHQIPC